VFGDEGVDEGEHEGAVAGVGFGDGGEVVAEDGLGGAEGPPGGVVDEEVVTGDPKGLGEPDDGVGAGGRSARIRSG
jgi:hypothetical protein